MTNDTRDLSPPRTTAIHVPGDPSLFAEDHQLRSRYIQHLLHTPAPRPTPSPLGLPTIPRAIVQFWHDLAALPADVEACLNSWIPLTNQGFTRVLFDDEQARQFILTNLGPRYSQAFTLCYHPAMRCDYFRLCYILVIGGFYIDADEVYQHTDCSHLFYDNSLKVQPLCYDMKADTMVHRDLFVEQRQSSASWIFYVNNNPLISPPGHPVVDLALQRATRILLSSADRPDIQSTTGPGNLSASLVRYDISSKLSGRQPGIVLIPNWEAISISPWTLSYRNDDRNWRLL